MLQLFIDTSGWAFTYPMCRLSGVRVACYVHYPTVSTDMLQRVRQRKSLYNNSAQISGSRPASWVKLLYYYFFAWFYSMAGACANVSAAVAWPASPGCAIVVVAGAS